jgi:hypothetical protein
VNARLVNGVTLTKKWQVKSGNIGDFAKFPDVEAQVVVKRGNGFVPAEEASGGAGAGVGGSPANDGNTARQDGGQGAGSGGLAKEPPDGPAPDFAGMTVEQLKNFLIAKGVAASDLRNTAKPELIERASAVWSQNKQPVA